ncbi:MULTISPECIES: C40 family peptidase [Methylomonas]|nr:MULTISPECIES: C40 family peptidase [Methylomonas]WNB75579.1 C40 family peptidase [Methylomonas koyamae]
MPMFSSCSNYRICRLAAPWLLALALGQLAGCASTEKAPPIYLPQTEGGNRMAVAEALQLQGAPYVYGGESPSEGFDCSGLVYYVYYRQGLRLPRDTQSLARQLPAVAPEQRLPGDLLFFNTERPYSHVGIYIGGEQFVHAPSARTGRVMVSDLRQPYWRERFIGVRRPLNRQALSFNSLDAGCGVN